MPWKETDVRSERIGFVVEALRGEESVSALCQRYGVSRKTGYKWLARYEQVGKLAELGELSRRPHRSPAQSPEELEQRVVDLRQHFGWGSRKLQWVLGKEGLKASRSTIDRILDRRGVQRGHLRVRPAVKRFAREGPNELLQMDFKGQIRLHSGGWCFPLSVLDDHSRFALAVSALPSPQAAGVETILRASFERYGVPESMLLDHGSPWWSSTSGYGLTKLGVFLIRQGVTLLYCAPNHPQTQGKVERFHRTLSHWIHHHRVPYALPDLQNAFVDFREEYNSLRPHEALAMQTPAQRYHPSPRPYRAQPPEWPYPAGSELRRVGHKGTLKIAGAHRFISEALQGHTVSLERFGSRILVSYRHMLIRELDLARGTTCAVVRPASLTGYWSSEAGGSPVAEPTSDPPVSGVGPVKVLPMS
jgi:transposase InsO family protein